MRARPSRQVAGSTAEAQCAHPMAPSAKSCDAMPGLAHMVGRVGREPEGHDGHALFNKFLNSVAGWHPHHMDGREYLSQW